ncbi:NAD(P)H-quinone oxidoreductase [Xylophilus sp. GOD-11R]|uniref:NAD(P)H-quinone oxidoreductase n=1 Tax=Xylophilus sp. GOD-11R TaxID=3089814 RepID=UPI00298D38B1|nr:NAD(P)H-quinone oxidoreductase [Xylophilus sp. GOD-11R]WPB59153.1 NAD(P)H-quinone oxidoreductase [Xylophilus sp. GOD-11R]
MKAITFESFGEADVLQLTDVPDPVVRPHDLLVRNRAAGVNRADLNQRRGAYGRADFGDSTLMGLEIAGEVVAMGDEVAGFAIGDRVMGIVGGGSYAELARFDHRMAIRVPEGMDIVLAGAIPEVFVTAHEALIHLGRLQPGEKVLIHAAAGGVGSAAVQLAHAVGAQVFATASASKHDEVRALGADVLVDHKAQDFADVVRAEAGERGVDVVIDFIGAPYLERNVRALAEGGRLVQVGLMGGSTGAALPLDRVLFRHLQIMGTVMKSRTPEVKQAMTRRFADAWLAHFGDGRLKPVLDRRYPLAEAAEAHRRMEAGLNVGKIVLVP